MPQSSDIHITPFRKVRAAWNSGPSGAAVARVPPFDGVQGPYPQFQGSSVSASGKTKVGMEGGWRGPFSGSNTNSGYLVIGSRLLPLVQIAGGSGAGHDLSLKDGSMAYLHIDLVLSALIGPEGAAIERFIAAAERGEHTLEILELALYCAWCSVRPGDNLNLSRFAKLLQVGQIVPSPKPFDLPSEEEIEHWRDVVFGRETD